jgi:hypothetical protein
VCVDLDLWLSLPFPGQISQDWGEVAPFWGHCTPRSIFCSAGINMASTDHHIGLQHCDRVPRNIFHRDISRVGIPFISARVTCGLDRSKSGQGTFDQVMMNLAPHWGLCAKSVSSQWSCVYLPNQSQTLTPGTFLARLHVRKVLYAWHSSVFSIAGTA